MHLNIPRILRILKRWQSRSLDYKSIISASSLEESLSANKARPLECFNGNIIRTKIVQGLIRYAQCSSFIETGTSHAATTIAASKLFGLPVFSCEISPLDFWVSRIMTLGIKDITLSNLDSPIFLNKISQNPAFSDTCPFFYLDAHEGILDKDSLPLVNELNIINQFKNFVVLIDDFKVPDNSHYRWGTYGGVDIDLALISHTLLSNDITKCYFPNHEASQETGYTSGYCIIFKNKYLNDTINNSKIFPFNHLKEHKI